MHKFWSSFLKYDPKKYWLERGKGFVQEHLYEKEKYRKQENILLNYLRKLEFSSVLEVGCGFGRMTQLLLKNFEIKDYLATDISPHLVNSAKKLCQNFTNVQFKVSDITDLQLNNKYDLVIGSEVLMHIRPTDIEQTIVKLIQYANKHVVNVDWYQKQKPVIHAGHNFVHDYEKIYNKNSSVLNVEKIDIEITPPSTLFHAEIIHK